MRTSIFIAALVLAGGIITARAQSDLAEFFPVADSVTTHPPFTTELEVFGQQKIMDRYISFVGFGKTKNVLYVTFTAEPVADPVADVSPIVGYDGPRPTLGKVQTWGYVFDRNGDGRVDYLALVGGAAAFEDGDFPPNFPRRSETLMLHHVELFVRKCKLVFNHWADDNFDGRLDGVIHVDVDPERDWVYRYIGARSLKFDGKFDDVWAFRTDTSSFNDSVSFTAGEVACRPIGAPAGAITQKSLEEKSAILTLINQAFEKFGRGKFLLPRGRQAAPGFE